MSRKTSSRAPTGRSLWKWLFAGVVIASALPWADRIWWRYQERSSISRVMAAYEDFGCAVCHGDASAQQLWRHDRSVPGSVAEIRAAVVEGRGVAPGFPGEMPAYGPRLSTTELQRVVAAGSVLAGVSARLDDSELEIGREIAHEMGCFRCHGPFGSGGVVNRYSRGGQVPGFFGASFRHAMSEGGGLEEIIRSGRNARPAWWMPWKEPCLVMPSYAGRLDSVEMGLLTRYLQWLTGEAVEGIH